MIHGILPAAGQAMRLRRLPKFLLPTDQDALTLIERHIEALSNICEVIWLPVRPDLIQLVHDLNLGSKVIPIALSTQSMTETVLKVSSLSGTNKFILGMPDTAFVGENPYSFLANSLDKHSLALALWKTAATQQGKVGIIEIQGDEIVESVDKSSSIFGKYHWGAMSFDRKFLGLLNFEMPHTGYGIRECIKQGIPIGFKITKGEYFDCGTFSEYKRFLMVETDRQNSN